MHDRISEELTIQQRETYAYLAGIFDGNGSVFIAQTIRNKRPVYWLQVQISARNVAFATWIAEHGRGHVSQGKFWKASSREAAAFLRLILPWLRLKRPQVQLAIAFQEFLSNKPPHAIPTPDELAIQDQYRKQIRALNEQQYRSTEDEHGPYVPSHRPGD
jgi:hypothetical protein